MIHYTSVEQAKKLVELGLKPTTADMWYDSPDKDYFSPHVGQNVSITRDLFSFREGYVIPCWSLGALIEVMALKKSVSGHAAAVIAFSQIMIDEKCSLIDAAYKGVCWALESNSVRYEDRK